MLQRNTAFMIFVFLLLYVVSPLISAFTFLHLCLIFITVLSMSSSCNRRKFRRPPALLKCWNSWAVDSEKLCKSSAACFTDGSPAGSLARPSTLFIDLHRRPSGTRAASREVLHTIQNLILSYVAVNWMSRKMVKIWAIWQHFR